MKNIALKIAATIFAALMLGPAQSALAGENIIIDGSTTVGPIAKAFAEFYKESHPDVNITISESGSGNGVKSLINKACNIANLSRFMKESEFKSCVANGVLPVAHVVAFDGLAVIVNAGCPIRSLTMSDIAAIYTGKITNWKQLGGDDAKIVVVSRDTNSGTYETFNELVLKKAKIVKDAEYVGSNGQARTRVNTTKDAIAYVGLGFVDDTVKPLSIEGILPNPKSITSGKYPIARPLFMFTNGYPKMGGDIFNFVTLHLSGEGREIISDLGYIPVCE